MNYMSVLPGLMKTPGNMNLNGVMPNLSGDMSLTANPGLAALNSLPIVTPISGGILGNSGGFGNGYALGNAAPVAIPVINNANYQIADNNFQVNDNQEVKVQNKVADAPTEEEKVQQDNAASLKELDAGAKAILEQATESKNNAEKQFSSIAEKLNAAGYEDKVVESDKTNAADTSLAGQKTKYLEIKDKNGNTTRIWDANGNGTLEAEDFNTNTYLKEFANDLKADAGVNKADQIKQANEAGGGNRNNNAENNVENQNVENKEVENKEVATPVENNEDKKQAEATPAVENKEQVADNNNVPNLVNPLLLDDDTTEITEEQAEKKADKADPDKEALIEKYILKGHKRPEAEKLAEAEILTNIEQ